MNIAEEAEPPELSAPESPAIMRAAKPIIVQLNVLGVQSPHPYQSPQKFATPSRVNNHYPNRSPKGA